MLPQTEIVLWTILEGPPKASQASECSELLDLTRAAYLIAAQRQPGKFPGWPRRSRASTTLLQPPTALCVGASTSVRQKISEIASMRPENGNV